MIGMTTMIPVNNNVNDDIQEQYILLSLVTFAIIPTMVMIVLEQLSYHTWVVLCLYNHKKNNTNDDNCE